TYAVRASQANGDAAELPAAFTVVAGAGKGILTTNLVVPNQIGRHTAATLYVAYSNTRPAPPPAPPPGLTAEQNGLQGALLTLDHSRVTQGFWTTANPDGYGQSVQFLGSGATPGVLQPGESVLMPVYYGGWLLPFDTVSHSITFQLGQVDTA